MLHKNVNVLSFSTDLKEEETDFSATLAIMQKVNIDTAPYANASAIT